MSDLRPFPDRPSLEFDRKAAKALLRQLRAGETHALERAHARGVHLAQSAEQFALADAQLIIAREYGFASWPRLVQYHGDIVRQARALEHVHTPEQWESIAMSLMAEHKARRRQAARKLAASVPRLYGMAPVEVLDVDITEADARLAVARSEGQPSWNALLRAEQPSRRPTNHWEISPLQQAAKAIDDNDVEKLKALIDNHPVLINPPAYEKERGATLANLAVGHPGRTRDLRKLGAEMRSYLESIQVDIKSELNRRLCGRLVYSSVEDVQAYLDMGADPNWIAPNGFSVLENAVLRYWNGAAVDLLASRATPRKSLWLAAGRGDIETVASFLDKDGKPTAAAREVRSPFDCGPFRVTPLFYPDNDELLIEALSLAAFNGRANVIDYLASRGVNLDNMAWGVPILNIAVGNGWLDSVEALIRNGARLDIPSENDSNGDARWMARWMWNNSNDSPEFRRIAELCGLDIQELRAERDAKLPKDPPFHPKLVDALALAQRAAHEQHKRTVTAEHLLLGILRRGDSPLLYYAGMSKLDRELFNAHIMPLATAIGQPEAGVSIPIDDDVRSFLDDAKAIAIEQKSAEVSVLCALYAMTRNGKGYAVDLVKRYGGSIDDLNRELRRAVLNEPR